MIKNSVRRKEKLRRMREEAKWLLSLIGEDWGIRVLPAGADKPRPVHANVNKRFEAVIGSRQRGRQVLAGKGMFDELLTSLGRKRPSEEAPARRTWLHRLSQRRIIRHFEGVPREFRIKGETVVKPETAYFTGRRTRKGETCLTLLMIDIDAHKVGDLKNAMEFAEHLRDNFLPDCYVEVSTNGNGADVFLIIDKTDWEDAEYNAVLKDFDRLAQGRACRDRASCWTPWRSRGRARRSRGRTACPSTRRASLAKLPRDWERFDELRASPTYTAHQLLAMPTPTRSKADIRRRCRRCARRAASPSQGVDPERIDLWTRSAKRLLPADVHVGKSVNNRLVVTSEDVGICCALLEFVGKKMNEDGTLPWARTKGLWDCLYQRGVVSRSFNAKRFAWIRRFLNGMGLVDVQDPTYVIGERAAKWSPSGRFWELASSLD